MKDKNLLLLKRIYMSMPEWLKHIVFRVKYENDIKKAFKTFLTADQLADSSYKNKTRKDILYCYNKYKIKAEEYFYYKFNNLTDAQRDEYLPDLVKDTVMNQLVGQDVYARELRDKCGFYHLMGRVNFNRKVFCFPADGDYATLKEFALEVKDLFLKRNSMSKGRGIIAKYVVNEPEAKALYDFLCKDGGVWIIEERIHQSEAFAEWNNSSVNTIRVPSVLSDGKFTIIAPFIRTGRDGAIVDNGGAGGIVACIDTESGIIISDGYDQKGRSYIEHPNSHKKYKGSVIPDWDSLKQYAEKLHRTIPHHKYVGWDFAHTDKGWILIEGNWGEFLFQQYILGRGLKNEFYQAIGIKEN